MSVRQAAVGSLLAFPYEPWTLSCGMVVEILDGASDLRSRTAQTAVSADGTQTAFLKLYDWRYATQLRDDKEMGPWAQVCAAAGREPFSSRDGGRLGRRPKRGFLAYQSRAMYRSETSVYGRLEENCRGEPLASRLVAAVELDMAPPELEDHCREHFQVKGILLEYIANGFGFTLSELSFRAPPESWQVVVEQAVKIARALGDYGVLNKDVRPNNFMVRPRRGSHGGDADGGPSGEYRVFVIDFGQSRLHRDDESDLDWGRAKWRQDEEGAVGLVMQNRLRMLGKEIMYTPSQRYRVFAERENDE
ncbi:hypothetical protein MYCTH_2109943 [Thermothelomyces thermophilus ATCC 42464]|uniref:Protein kinase domain-containing protein n=1 Tax=Thermothelomyces thermophilus (strain ATCC 42464 / BCRC 31852 / DSM 1799) TaxID=573729 RepID=G2QDL8_THET4|nr:uncharacterized protein MYCTH_2109943 [Thermothelomyces thermophilus ATCC 42464]AEO57530.1 hypothetical protein MYCTH_2109943 [Thermothelomyces thermophilus ATCC 42464]